MKISAIPNLFGAKNAALLFATAVLVGYGVVGLIAYWETQNSYFLQLVFLAVTAVVVVFLFSRLRLTQCALVTPQLIVNRGLFALVAFSGFFGFALLVLATAEGVPLLAWVAGADQETLVLLREKFLKARDGWQAIFPYINAMLTGALLPYCLACLFIDGYRWRWLAFAVFLLYCVLFIEKVFFLRAIIPLLYVAFCVHNARLSLLITAVAGSFLLLVLLGLVSGFGGGDGVTDVPFFSSKYVPAGTVSYLFWRALAVPVFTAADSLALFKEELNSTLLLGATSSLLAKLFFLERVNLEQLVFTSQWGQSETGTASANAVYFVDAYVNFGITGVIVYSAIVGMLFRLISKSSDQALHAIWPLFAFSLYVSGLVGTLASNAFLAVFLLSVLTQNRRFTPAKSHAKPHRV
jgi:hypothetical protein